MSPILLDENRHPHSLLLNDDDLLLSWSIDWRNEAVLFNVDNAFSATNKYFTFGFTKWGREEQADLCLFDRDDWEEEQAIVCRPANVPNTSDYMVVLLLLFRTSLRTSMASVIAINNRTGRCYASTVDRWPFGANSTPAIRSTICGYT